MSQPRLELTPLRPAVRTDAQVTQDILITVYPPDVSLSSTRPPLNLGLVIDRSGSMGGDKIDYAKQAAIFAVEQLLPTDRVSVTVFDDDIQTIVPNTLANNKGPVIQRIRQVAPGGSTALHGAWQEGSQQVHGNLLAGGLNRVLVLSDGLANAGETNPDTIASHVHRTLGQGVSTTTLGVGNDYNEDLMAAMARSGDGNYYFIDSPEQIPAIFNTELQGLMATLGNHVSLGLEPMPGAALVGVFNELDRTPAGRLKLANLLVGMPMKVAVRLTIPPQANPADVLRVRLAWTDSASKDRQQVFETLTLQPVAEPAWEQLTPNQQVQDQVNLLLVVRAEREAAARYAAGDIPGTQSYLRESHALLAMCAPSPEVDQERSELQKLEQHLNDADGAAMSKRAKFRSHQRSRSKL